MKDDKRIYDEIIKAYITRAARLVQEAAELLEEIAPTAVQQLITSKVEESQDGATIDPGL